MMKILISSLITQIFDRTFCSPDHHDFIHSFSNSLSMTQSQFLRHRKKCTLSFRLKLFHFHYKLRIKIETETKLVWLPFTNRLLIVIKAPQAWLVQLSEDSIDGIGQTPALFFPRSCPLVTNPSTSVPAWWHFNLCVHCFIYANLCAR